MNTLGSASLPDHGNETWSLIRDWVAQTLVSLIEDNEFELLGVPELPEMTENLGIRWIYLPIVDLDIPDGRFEETWETAGKELRQLLADGGKVVLHCRGGLGRTGMIAARLLVEFTGSPCGNCQG